MPVKFEEYRETSEERGFDWTLQEGSNAHRVLEFLAEHPEQGFTPKEIHEATGVARGSVGKTLQRLEERQLVRHAEPYWAIGEQDRVGAYLSMVSSLESIGDREGVEDYEEWREAADTGE